MSIFGPTDTRNYKKLAKQIFDIETRFANMYCDMYAFIHGGTKFSVMDAARPAGGLLYMYGVILVANILEQEDAKNENYLMMDIFARVHKKPTSVFSGLLDEDPKKWREQSLIETDNMLYGINFPNDKDKGILFKQFYDEVEAVVNKWKRDEF